MNKDVIRKWIKALRGGGYKQCFGKLHIDDRFCVLGVLCDIHSKEEGEEWKRDKFYSDIRKSDIYRYRANLDILPRVVEHWANVDMGGALLNQAVDQDGTDFVQSLTGLNDLGIGFEALADIIEKRAKIIDPSFAV